MPKLDSNFGAPFHVISRDQHRVTGVVASFNDRAEADTAAGNLKANLDATGNESTDVYVVAGQEDLAAFIEQEDGIPAAVQTDNSGAREAQQVEQLTAANDDGADTANTTTDEDKKSSSKSK